jgi:hypothetical protein
MTVVLDAPTLLVLVGCLALMFLSGTVFGWWLSESLHARFEQNNRLVVGMPVVPVMPVIPEMQVEEEAGEALT